MSRIPPAFPMPLDKGCSSVRARNTRYGWYNSSIRFDNYYMGHDWAHDSLVPGLDMNSLPKHDHTYDNGYAILTNAEVREIRRRYDNGERQSDLAREFGVTRYCIYGIVHFKRRNNAGQ